MGNIFHCDATGWGIHPKGNIAEITRKKHVRKSVTSIIKSLEGTKANCASKGKSNNTARTKIYEHFNEKDNNSNKLPQHGKKRTTQPPDMMYMNKIMPATLMATTLLLTSMAAGATAVTAVSLPRNESSLLMPKEQLNKAECNKITEGYDNKAKEEAQIYEIKLGKADQSISSNSNNNNVLDITNNNIKHKMIKSKFYKIFFENKLSKTKDKHSEIPRSIKPDEIRRKNLAKLTTFQSKVHEPHELILQFAVELKQIPRVTYFTCGESAEINKSFNKNKKKNSNYQLYNGSKRNLVKLIARLFSNNSAGLMVKMVSIDHLVKKNRKAKSNTKMSEACIGFGDCGGVLSNATAQNDAINLNWLRDILRPEPLRQIVVLNLSCGPSSRRLLELASNQALFNSMYHWLLLEDYVYKRQPVIDDADDIENRVNSIETDRSFKEEIVNDSNASANGQVKQLFSYLKDVAGVCTCGLSSDEQNNFTASNSGPPSATPSAKPSAIRLNTVADCGQQLRLLDDNLSSTVFNASRAGTTEECEMEVIEQFLQKLNINVNTELTLAKRCTPLLPPTSNSSSHLSFLTPSTFSLTSSTASVLNDYKTLLKMDYYLLYDVWNPGLQYGGVLNITKIGNFTRNEGLHLEKWYRTTSTIRRRLNMQLANVRCLIVVTHKNRSSTLEEYLTSHYDTHLDSMNRFNFALLTHVRDVFNFSFILTNTSSWGYLRNGKFDGMIGALVEKRADIGGSPIFFRIERAKVIDYTTKTWLARPCFIFRHPRSTNHDRIVFLQPFSNEVWICLLACGCSTIIFLWLLTSLERKFCHGDFNLIQEGGNANSSPRFGLFFESSLFYVGSLCQQGLPLSPFFMSGRFVVITSLLFSFAAYQFYSASIVGSLLMEKPKTIRTLRDLIHSSLEIGIEDIVYNKDFFLRTNDIDALELYKKKMTSVRMATNDVSTKPMPAKPKLLRTREASAYNESNEASNWYNPDYGMRKVKKGHFAFHVDVATAYKIIADTFSEKEICDLSEIQLYPPQRMVTIVQKGSPLRKVITYGLRRATEVGLTDYQRKVWHSPKPHCIKQLHASDLMVDMQTFTSALLLLIFGYAASLMILSLEIVCFKLWQQHTTSRI